MLNSSDRGGIRIQYSRNPFGKKRDYDGSYINTPTAATYTAPSYEASAVAAPAYGSGGAVPAAYSSGDYSAPATAPSVDGAQQANGQAAGYDAAAAAQPGSASFSVHDADCCLLPRQSSPNCKMHLMFGYVIVQLSPECKRKMLILTKVKKVRLLLDAGVVLPFMLQLLSD